MCSKEDKLPHGWQFCSSTCTCTRTRARTHTGTGIDTGTGTGVHTATPMPIACCQLYNTPQHSASLCNILHDSAALQHSATLCNAPQQNATHCNTRPHRMAVYRCQSASLLSWLWNRILRCSCISLYLSSVARSSFSSSSSSSSCVCV